MRLAFFSKCRKFDVEFRNAAKIWENVLVSLITEYQLDVVNCLYYEEETLPQQPLY